MIAATNSDLKKMVAENTFREDSFYRLNVIPVRVPRSATSRGHSTAGPAFSDRLVKAAAPLAAV